MTVHVNLQVIRMAARSAAQTRRARAMSEMRKKQTHTNSHIADPPETS